MTLRSPNFVILTIIFNNILYVNVSNLRNIYISSALTPFTSDLWNIAQIPAPKILSKSPDTVPNAEMS